MLEGSSWDFEEEEKSCNNCHKKVILKSVRCILWIKIAYVNYYKSRLLMLIIINQDCFSWLLLTKIDLEDLSRDELIQKIISLEVHVQQLR